MGEWKTNRFVEELIRLFEHQDFVIIKVELIQKILRLFKVFTLASEFINFTGFKVHVHRGPRSMNINNFIIFRNLITCSPLQGGLFLGFKRFVPYLICWQLMLCTGAFGSAQAGHLRLSGQGGTPGTAQVTSIF